MITRQLSLPSLLKLVEITKLIKVSSIQVLTPQEALLIVLINTEEPLEVEISPVDTSTRKTKLKVNTPLLTAASITPNVLDTKSLAEMRGFFV